MRCWVVVIVMLASSVALAQPDKIKAEAAARDGQQRYQSGAYLLAAERFELAYELDPDPAYLFNLAQAYRLAAPRARRWGARRVGRPDHSRLGMTGYLRFRNLGT